MPRRRRKPLSVKLWLLEACAMSFVLLITLSTWRFLQVKGGMKQFVQTSLEPNKYNFKNQTEIEALARSLEARIIRLEATLARELGDFASWREKATGFCDSVFGNGFDEEFGLCQPSLNGSGAYVNCSYNEFTKATLCRANNVLFRRKRLNISNGGEDILKVWGREEWKEFPRYGSGSFATSCKMVAPLPRHKLKHHLSKIFAAFQYDPTPEEECTVWHDKTTLFITRYEYANLYHTYTDWYNAYQAMRILGIESVDIVFFDGHSKGILDQTWQNLFKTTPKYASQISQGACFREVIFVPPGYTSSIGIDTFVSTIRKPDRCVGSPYVREFANAMLSAYGIEPMLYDYMPYTHGENFTGILVCRKDYVAHPRAIKGAPTTRKFKDAEGMKRFLKSIGVVVELVYLEDLSFKDQLLFFLNSSIIIGMHGAGLSHILVKAASLNLRTALLEIMAIKYGARPHFEFFARVSDIGVYKKVTASSANPREEHTLKEIKLERAIQHIRTAFDAITNHSGSEAGAIAS